MKLRALFAALALLAAGSASAASLPPGVDLLPGGLKAGSLCGQASLGADPAVRAVQGQGGALALETLRALENIWDAQFCLPNAAPLAKGDRCLLSFEIRGLKSRAESGEASSEVAFELNRGPWTKSLSFPLRAGREWRKLQLPFAAAESYKAGEAKLAFRLGYGVQALELRGLSLINYGDKVALESLPRTRLSYRGREAGAAWRKQAAADIRRLRTADLKVQVVDEAGKPVKGAKVSLRQLRNAFHFGSAVSGHLLFRDKAQEAQRQRYTAEIRRLFNMATEENALKWPASEGDWGKDYLGVGAQSRDFVLAQGLDFRGHTLIWPSWRNLPKSMQKLEKDPPALKKRALDHIEKTAAEHRGKVSQWDVLNEPFDNHDLMDILGQGFIAEAFQAARRGDPGAQLYINDYAILPGGPMDTPHRRHYEATIDALLKAGAPLDGIGLQGHFGSNLTDPADLKTVLDRYGRFGKQLMITEFDIDGDDEELAGDYLRDLLTVFYAHPAAAGFVMWGFWDGVHWHKSAPLFRADWTPKPALKVWEQLVLKDWATRAEGLSRTDGSFAARAHLGEYEIEAELGGKKVQAKASLDKGGQVVKLVLP